jgi:hypothetical protein
MCCVASEPSYLHSATIFHQRRLLTQMTQSWSFNPGANIPLQNKKKRARPTRFERVTFAFGAI